MRALPSRELRIAATAITLAATCLVVVDAPGPVRATVVLVALLVAPGLAAVPALPVDTAVGQVAAAVGLSIAALVLVSEALLYIGVSGAGWAFAVLACLTLAACGVPAPPDQPKVES